MLLPPSDLSTRQPELVTVAAGQSVHRFHTAAFDPFFFDTSREGRLNAPDGSYGVMYVARETAGAFAETFLRMPGATLLDDGFVRRKAYARFEVLGELRLARMAGPGLARLGATAEIVHGGLPYDSPQTWSAALHVHKADVDGIAYNARHDDEAMCYAIFDRARARLREAERRTDLDTDWFWRLASRYGVGLAPAS